MADKYVVNATFDLKKADGTQMAKGEITYENLEYDDVTLLEGTVMGAIAEIGLEESKKKKDKK